MRGTEGRRNEEAGRVERYCTLPLQSPLTTLLCITGGYRHLFGGHFIHYQQPTTDRLQVLQGETGERGSVSALECA